MENEQLTNENETEQPVEQPVETEQPVEVENTEEAPTSEVVEDSTPEPEKKVDEREGFIPRDRFDKVNQDMQSHREAFLKVAERDFVSNPKEAIKKYRDLGYDTSEWEKGLVEQERQERMKTSEYVHVKDIDSIVEQKLTAKQQQQQARQTLDNDIKEAEKLGVPANDYLVMVRDHGLTPKQASVLHNAENLKAQGAREEADRIASQGRGAIVSNTKAPTGSKPDFQSMSVAEMTDYLNKNGMGVQ